MAEKTPSEELVAFLASALVSDREALRVREDDREGVVELEAAPDDRGRVIGRQGRIAKAMRAILAATPEGAELRLEILD